MKNINKLLLKVMHSNYSFTAACGLGDDEMVENVSTILKSKRFIEVEKCGFIEDIDDKENSYLTDENLPSIMPPEFIEVDDNSENVAYERQSSETKVRRVKEGVISDSKNNKIILYRHLIEECNLWPCLASYDLFLKFTPFDLSYLDETNASGC